MNNDFGTTVTSTLHVLTWKRIPNVYCSLSDYRFMLRRLGHAYEIYPIFALTGAWFVLFCYAVYYSFEKMEIWLDRSEGFLNLLDKAAKLEKYELT